MKKIISMFFVLGALTACPGNSGTVVDANALVGDSNVVVDQNTTLAPAVDANITQDANTQQ